jgi:hypothetical protein
MKGKRDRDGRKRKQESERVGGKGSWERTGGTGQAGSAVGKVIRSRGKSRSNFPFNRNVTRCWKRSTVLDLKCNGPAMKSITFFKYNIESLLKNVTHYSR